MPARAPWSGLQPASDAPSTRMNPLAASASLPAAPFGCMGACCWRRRRYQARYTTPARTERVTKPATTPTVITTVLVAAALVACRHEEAAAASATEAAAAGPTGSFERRSAAWAGAWCCPVHDASRAAQPTGHLPWAPPGPPHPRPSSAAAHLAGRPRNGPAAVPMLHDQGQTGHEGAAAQLDAVALHRQPGSYQLVAQHGDQVLLYGWRRGRHDKSDSQIPGGRAVGRVRGGTGLAQAAPRPHELHPGRGEREGCRRLMQVKHGAADAGEARA